GLCSTDSSIITNFSNSWSMIAGQGACEWAQSGFENRYNKPIQHFAQVAKNCGSVTTVYWPTNLVSGEKHAYRSLYNSSTGRVESKVDTTIFITSIFPMFGTWTQPFDVQFMGEVGYMASGMPGSPSSQTAFSALGAQQVVD